MNSDVPEIDVDRRHETRAAAAAGNARGTVQGKPWLRYGLVAVAFLVIGLLIGAAWSSKSGLQADPQVEQPNPTIESDPSPVRTEVATSAPEPSMTPQAEPTPTDIADMQPAVRLLGGAAALQGGVVLAPFAPFGKPETVWVIEPGRLISRPDVPLRPGDWPHYLLLTGSHIALTSPPDAYVLPADLSKPANRVVPARYLVPGASPGLVWAINDTVTGATPIDMNTGEPGDEVPLGDEISWVSAAVANGFVVNPKDHGTYGNVAFLVPNQPLVPIELPEPTQSGINGTAGNIAVVVSPGPRISALDVTNGDLSGLSIDVGSGLVVGVCLSPNQRYAVVVGSTVRSVVVDFELQEVVARISVSQEFHAVGWTSESQLVYIFDDVLRATDVVSGEEHEIARIEPDTFWTVTGSAAMC